MHNYDLVSNDNVNILIYTSSFSFQVIIICFLYPNGNSVTLTNCLGTQLDSSLLSLTGYIALRKAGSSANGRVLQ